jgi:lipopolysaccharide biosynthesis glycosyltransferase
VGNLASPANYARFFMPALLPNVNKVIWLDCDTIVMRDIRELWNMALPNGEWLAAIERTSFKYGNFFDGKVQALYKDRYGVAMDTSESSFNAGVFVADLGKWREHKLLDEVFYWMVYAVVCLWRC